MKRFLNWRDILPLMVNHKFDYNNRQEVLSDYKINEGQRTVSIFHGDKTVVVSFRSMETILGKWTSLEPGFNHLEASREAEEEKGEPTNLAVAPTNNLPAAGSESDKIKPIDIIQAKTLDFLTQLDYDSQETIHRINETITALKQQGSGENFSKNQGKQILNALNIKNKTAANFLNAMQFAKELFVDKPKPPEEPPTEP